MYDSFFPCPYYDRGDERMEEPMNEMDERMDRFRIFFRNNGFYVVLVLCLLVVGVAIALLAWPKQTDMTAEAPTDDAPIVIVGQSNDERLNEALSAPTAVPVPPTPIPKPSVLPVLSPVPATPEPTAKHASTSEKAAPPVKGEVIFGYAVDKLLYSVTLDQWTTHDAVDIAADAGTEVKCVFSGTVERVGKDDALGYTVVVQHANGRSTLYGNLAENVRVHPGDKVSAGDVLGTVGTSAISECALKPHLHFAVYVDGTPKDPAKYVRLG